MAVNSNMSDVMEKAVSTVPQSVGDWGAMMLPISSGQQVALSYAISHVAYQLMVDVFDIATSQGFSFDTMGLKLKQIEKKIDEMAKKLDKLLKADLETAKNRLRHAVNYLKLERNYHLAYEEFKLVLTSAENAYPKIEDFEDKVLCKQLQIYSRLMTTIYDVDTRTFTPLSNIPEEEKVNIAESVFIDVEDILKDFHNIKIPLTKSLLGKKADEQQKNQDALDSLLKRCLPAIWHYQPVFSGSYEDAINKYVPEGLNDATTIFLKNGAQILIWKRKRKLRCASNIDSEFKFQWFPKDFHFQATAIDLSMNYSNPFNDDETIYSNHKHSIEYKFKNGTFKTLKSYLEHSKDSKTENINQTAIVSCSDFNDLKRLSIFDNSTKMKFEGHWYSDFIEKIKSKEQFVMELKNLPESVRFKMKDNWGDLIVNHLLCYKKEWVDKEVMELVLNEVNSLEKDQNNCTPLHYACQTNELNIVKGVVEKGGYNGIKSKHGQHPSDMTTNQEIKEYLKTVKQIIIE